MIAPAKQILIERALKETITKVKSAGYDILSVTMDQEPSHQALSNQLEYSINDVPIIFDVPHLIKNLRTCLFNYIIKVGKF